LPNVGGRQRALPIAVANLPKRDLARSICRIIRCRTDLPPGRPRHAPQRIASQSPAHSTRSRLCVDRAAYDAKAAGSGCATPPHSGQAPVSRVEKDSTQGSGKSTLSEGRTARQPGREHHAILDEFKRSVGSMVFAAQYQQEPVPEGEQPGQMGSSQATQVRTSPCSRGTT
jgi:hypothetical protein